MNCAVLVVWSVLLLLPVYCGPGQPVGPDGTSTGQQGDCPAEGCPEGDGHCTWQSREGVWYNLEALINKQYQFPLSNPKGAVLKFHVCSNPLLQPPCRNGVKSPACITVPGVTPSSTGKTPRIEQLEPNIPSMGIRLVYEDGDTCEVTKVPRRTIIKLPCSQRVAYSVKNWNPQKVWEGEGKEICHYFVEFPPSRFGCPSELGGSAVTGDQSNQLHVDTVTTFSHNPHQQTLVERPSPEITAVTGCMDSDPARTTRECHFAGKVNLVLHGINFHALCDSGAPPSSPSISAGCVRDFSKQFAVMVGEVECVHALLVSQYQINCTIEKGSGSDLDVAIKRKSLSFETSGDFGNGVEPGGARGLESGGVEWVEPGGVGPGRVESGGRREVKPARGNMEEVANLQRAVSFKEKINYRERFDKFVDMGVGGMKREIDELYRRAFASRGTSAELLGQLGVSHVKGILLYGPPGSGKTLLARTIGKILGSNQVSLINGPEIISKFLGESERNLRLHFKEAHAKWSEYGMLSDLYVIIIDEIDAICKPRGKTDQSAAGVAYDALVNQLLTLMDGLNEVHNVLVIGLTNRRELLDPALLRPGRFEVQIEVTLPDEEGRREIFEIHTREMRKNGLLGGDVDSRELASNTSRLSGAEIAGVVRAASSYALERHQKLETSDPAHSVLVTAVDFSRAIREINPAYTHSESHVLSNFLPLGYLPCGEAHDSVIDSVLDMIHILLSSSMTRSQSLLLYGPRGSGKTALAAHLAMMGRFSYVKILTAASLVGMNDAVKLDVLYQTFSDAYKADSAIIILDDLHRLVEYVQVGTQLQVSHSLLHALFTLLTTTPPSNTKLMVVATMTCSEKTLRDYTSLGLPDLFAQHEMVPLLGPDEARRFIAARNVRRTGGGQFALPGNLSISVRQLLYSIDCTCAANDVTCSLKHPSFVDQEHLHKCIMGAISN